MVGIALMVTIHCSPAVLNNFGYSAIVAIVVPLVDFVICLLFGSSPIFVDFARAVMHHFSKNSSQSSRQIITGIDLYDVAPCTVHKKWLNFLAEFSRKY